jgi:RNA polymerase sigma-70 factor (ECF subfamily)
VVPHDEHAAEGWATATLPPEIHGPEDFVRLADPFRAELLAHCYRMLGSVQDAEDQVQETYLRAWRSYGDFEGRSSLRTWLHRIATNVCLTALDGRRRLPVPSGFPDSEGDDDGQAPWQASVAERPPAGSGVDPGLTDPAAVLVSREHRTGALTFAWRHLSPRQRAVLVLRDVLDWQATEIAALMGTSGAAVHSMVRRARAQLAQVPADAVDPAPDDATQRRLLEDYAAMFETGDVGSMVKLLTDGAVCELPGSSGTATGRAAIRRLFATCPALGDCRMVAVTVAGRPGFGIYRRHEDDGTYRAHGIDLLATSRSGITRIDVIEDRSLFSAFGLPKVHPGGPGTAAS